MVKTELCPRTGVPCRDREICADAAELGRSIKEAADRMEGSLSGRFDRLMRVVMPGHSIPGYVAEGAHAAGMARRLEEILDEDCHVNDEGEGCAVRLLLEAQGLPTDEERLYERI